MKSLCLLHALPLLLPVLQVLLPTPSAFKFPKRKTWWAKKITDDLYVTGRLTETQMKLLKDNNFKSLISLFNFRTRDLLAGNVNDSLPSSEEASRMTADFGMKYSVIMVSDGRADDWMNEDTMADFTRVFKMLPKPVVLYDTTGYASSFIALMYYLTNEPKISVKTFFKRSAVMGYPHVSNDRLRALVLKAGNAQDIWEGDLAHPILNIPNWYTQPAQWWHRPLTKNIWVCGQVQVNHLAAIRMAGFDVVINLRRGMNIAGVPSQEESVLVNINDRTGTYDKDKKPYRQTREALESNRLDRNLPNTYISPNSSVNYQKINYLQFGDQVGYSEDISRKAFRDAGIDYIHFPVGGLYGYDISMWEAYRDRLIELGKTKNILIQCRSAARSTVLGILMHGCIYHRSSAQALELAKTIGFPWLNDNMNSEDTAVVTLVRSVLDNRKVQCNARILSGGNHLKLLCGGSQELKQSTHGVILVFMACFGWMLL